MKQKYLFGKTMVYMSALSASAASIVRLPRIIHGHDMHSKAINPEGAVDDKEAVEAFNAAIDKALEDGWHLTTTAALEDAEAPAPIGDGDEIDDALKEADEKLAEAAKSLEAKDETISALNKKIEELEGENTALKEEAQKLSDELEAAKTPAEPKPAKKAAPKKSK